MLCGVFNQTNNNIMEIRKLLDFLWDKVENDEIDGDIIPDLQICEEELNILLEAYAFKKIER